jgi:hypothetical protein
VVSRMDGTAHACDGVPDIGMSLCGCMALAISQPSTAILRRKDSQDIFYDVEDVPLPASTGEPQAESNYTDGSGALFSMYLDRAEEEDKKAAERWKGDADGILVFVRPPLKEFPVTSAIQLIVDHSDFIYHRLVCSRPRSPLF